MSASTKTENILILVLMPALSPLSQGNMNYCVCARDCVACGHQALLGIPRINLHQPTWSIMPSPTNFTSHHWSYFLLFQLQRNEKNSWKPEQVQSLSSSYPGIWQRNLISRTWQSTDVFPRLANKARFATLGIRPEPFAAFDTQRLFTANFMFTQTPIPLFDYFRPKQLAPSLFWS